MKNKRSHKPMAASRARKKILGVPFDLVTRKQALDTLLRFLKQNRCHMVFTPNPEIVLAANKDQELMTALKGADLVVPDGTGIVLASMLDKVKFKERVPGCDLFEALFDTVSSRVGGKLSVYILGAKPGVAERAQANIEKRYDNVEVVGLHHGYFDVSEEKMIIRQIQELKPDVLLVGFNLSRQEKWIYQHRKRLPVRIAAALGGSIDVYAGEVKRAPAIWRRLGLEWFYRLISEPWRAKRMVKLPVFAIKILANKFIKGKHNEYR